MENIRISLEACRVNARKTQSEWAKLIGVTLNTISNWESGKTEPSLSNLRRISDLSGVPMDYIFMPCNSFQMN